MISAQVDNVGSVLCPVCKMICEVPGGAPDRLSTNAYALNIIQLAKRRMNGL